MKNIALFAAILLASHAGFAGSVVRYHVVDSSFDPPRQEWFTILVGTDRMKIDVPQAPGRTPGVGIFHADLDKVIMVDHQRKTFSPVTRAEAVALGNQVNETVGQLSDVLGSLPDDQRSALEGLLGGAIPAPTSAAVNARLIDTGKRHEVSGISCRELNALEGEKMVGKLCVADWKNVPQGVQIKPVVEHLASFTSEVASSLGSIPGLPDLLKSGMLGTIESVGGMPIYLAAYDAMTRKIFEARLGSIRQQDIGNSTFDVPDGYTPAKLF